VSVTFHLGDSPQLTYLAYADDVLTDATVVLTVTAPDGTQTSPAITRTATGTYLANVDVAQLGIWSFVWTATGAVEDSESGSFRVQSGASAKVYATLEELREWFGDESARLDPGQLHRTLASVSRAIDRHCGRRFWRDNTATARTFRAEEPGLVWTGDFWSAAGLIVEADPAGNGVWSQVWDAGDYQLEPLNAAADLGSDGAFAWWQIAAVGSDAFPVFPRRVGVRVTAKWGWSAVPDQVTEAALLKAASLFKRRDAPFGFAEVGDLGVIRIGRNDPDVVEMLRPFVHVRPRTLNYDPQATSLFHRGRR
jgi:hypothetical protein